MSTKCFAKDPGLRRSNNTRPKHTFTSTRQVSMTGLTLHAINWTVWP